MDPIFEFMMREKQEKLHRYQILNQYAQKGQIVFTGSSLIEQFPVCEFAQNDNVSKIIYNRAIGGYTTAELLAALETCIFDLAPAKLFINIGTNDLNSEIFIAEKLADQYAEILQIIRFRLPNVRLYMIANFPMNEMDDFGIPEAKFWFQFRTNKRIETYNEQVRKLATRFAATYVDLNRNLVDHKSELKREYSAEGIHIYGNGYHAIWSDLLSFIMD